MTNVLIINGQPNPHGLSSTGRILAELAKRLPEAQIRAVADTVTEDKTYVAAEQEALKKADVIVWQFPIYWNGLTTFSHTALRTVAEAMP